MGAVYRSPGICPIAEENPWKISSRRPSDEGYATSHRLKLGPLPPNEVGRISQHVRKGEGRKELGLYTFWRYKFINNSTKWERIDQYKKFH